MSYRVLIVEESADSREQMTEAVRAVGEVEVTSVQSGFEALQLLPRQRFDLIITDTRTRDIDGFELANFVKKSPPYRSTPLFLISEGFADEERARGLSLGASAFLTKPFESPDLEALVREHLVGVATA